MSEIRLRTVLAVLCALYAGDAGAQTVREFPRHLGEPVAGCLHEKDAALIIQAYFQDESEGKKLVAQFADEGKCLPNTHGIMGRAVEQLHPVKAEGIMASFFGCVLKVLERDKDTLYVVIIKITRII